MPACQSLRALAVLALLAVAVSADASPASNTTTRIPSPTYTRSASNTSICQPISINYISPGLPQQCLRSRHSSPGSTVSAAPSTVSATDSPSASPPASNTPLSTEIAATASANIAPSLVSPPPPPSTSNTPSPAAPPLTPTHSQAPKPQPPETETEDSPLDTAKFLSFEEWKNQNLAKVGQSADSFEARGVREPRKALPGAGSAALDSMGEDFEIDVGGDSTGATEKVVQVSASIKASGDGPTGNGGGGGAGVIPRSQDAGKTCKERFNYASFDCAATVHKTNKEAKSVNSILVESKETYMLNKCSAKEKFFIVELCEDILVDTVVLANFEFFSSVFKELRVSVSDRYPVKLNGWRILGTFVAKNTRDVQAFLIENPWIWARYMKIEILSHYGHEYYCPVSLFRVHGTTMMEEFRHQEEAARGEVADDVREEIMPEAVADPIKSAENETKESGMEIPIPTTKEAPLAEETPAVPSASPTEAQTSTPMSSKEASTEIRLDHCSNSQLVLRRSRPSCPLIKPPEPLMVFEPPFGNGQRARSSLSAKTDAPPPASSPAGSTVTTAHHQSGSSPSSVSVAIAKAVTDPKTPESRPPLPSNNNSPHAAPPHPNPGTQESFFKSVHKRLTHLEGNATLSLQYIEEQSRILRDAFAKMEKKQIAKVEQMLEKLNQTAFADLRGYREKYDQLWQSTVIALETQRSFTEHEMRALSERLSLVADEVIFQKRLYQLNTILLLITIGVVIFSRNERLVVPLSRHLRTRSSAGVKGSGLGLESPPNSPTPTSATGLNMQRRMGALRRDSSDSLLAPTSPIEYGNGTPTSPSGNGGPVPSSSASNPTKSIHFPSPPRYSSREASPALVTESKSSPPTPSGARGTGAKGWIAVGPHLRVEGQGRRWVRLPSPLGSSADLRAEETEGEEEEGGEGVGLVEGRDVEGEPGDAVYSDERN